MARRKKDAIWIRKFIAYEEAKGYPDNLGTLGGFFRDGMRWKDYLEISGYNAEGCRCLEALRSYIVKHRIRRGGDWHQHSKKGVPLFSDGSVACYSYRAWGDLMAAIWSEHDNRDYCYMDFYMDCLLKEAGDVGKSSKPEPPRP
jgi:hypothetical protein